MEATIYSNWDLPPYLFAIAPVGRRTLDNFVSRQKVVDQLSKAISRKNTVAVLEGEIGCGKTSLGNYIRFSQGHSFSTDVEIMCRPHWGARELLLALQSALLVTCSKSHEYLPLLELDHFKRLLERNKNIRLSSANASVSLMGVGGIGGGGGSSISHPLVMDEQSLLDELNSMIKEIKKVLSKKNSCDIDNTRVIFQLNNLDPDELPFTSDNIVEFLNTIRDLIATQVDASFILNGATGIKKLLLTKVKRLSDCSLKFTISPLKEKEVIEALNKRIENANCRGELPFEADLLKEIYLISHGNFRKILAILNQLADHYDSEEILIEKISRSDCIDYFSNNFSEDLKDIAYKRSGELTTKGKIIKFLASHPACSINQIDSELELGQSNVSANISTLVDKGYVEKLKADDGVSVECYLIPEYLFAAPAIF